MNGSILNSWPKIVILSFDPWDVNRREAEERIGVNLIVSRDRIINSYGAYQQLASEGKGFIKIKPEREKGHFYIFERRMWQPSLIRVTKWRPSLSSLSSTKEGHCLQTGWNTVDQQLLSLLVSWVFILFLRKYILASVSQHMYEWMD